MSTTYDELVKNYGLQKLNSLTKYPSILTYHNLGEKGTLVNSLVEDKSFAGKKVFVTEKIDGTNSRIIAFTDKHGYIWDYLIGSREDILYAHGDRIINPTLGIVETVKPFAEYARKFDYGFPSNSICCFYGETYGGNINGGKNYTNDKTYGFRMFDFWHMDIESAKEILKNDIDKIASWREHDGQPFVDVDEISDYSEAMNIPTVPYIKEIDGSEIPITLSETYKWLCEFQKSNAILNDNYVGESKAEGVVVRTADRSLIRKIRFEDYEKTKRKLGF